MEAGNVFRLGTDYRLRLGPFSISNPQDRVFFMERTFMCLVSFRANAGGGNCPG